MPPNAIRQLVITLFFSCMLIIEFTVAMSTALRLEVFSKLPDFNLTVCGPIEEEQAFVKAYSTELFETANINTVGWVDVISEEFIGIMNKCVALIYPTCSEGGGGSVITCMHGGLIPIVSYEASVDVNSAGIILKNCSIEEIKKSIKL